MLIEHGHSREFPAMLQKAERDGAAYVIASLHFDIGDLPLASHCVVACELIGDERRFFVMSDAHARSYAQFDARKLARDEQVSTLVLSKPWRLDCLSVEKPWGRELWYTGIEARGVNAVLADHGPDIPLPYLLQSLGESITGVAAEAPVLLKILAPHPEPVFGDLYFELHEQKQEVYIVTDVDERAWPEGEGAIKIGFNPALREEYASEGAFKAAFQAAVAEYRAVREACDAAIDGMRDEAGIALNAAVPAAQSMAWVEALPEGLKSKEQELRAAMDRFTALHPVKRGDVVVIPKYLPHALQHGVRTVEFQTPHYERCIVSFAQKVLTQGHWDTAEAMQKCVMRDYVTPRFPRIDRPGVLAERIVDFAEFQAYRVTLEPGAQLELRSGGAYALMMLIDGKAVVGDKAAPQEQALLIPRVAFPSVLQAKDSGAVLLLAFPAEPAEYVEAEGGLWHNFAR